MRELTSVWAPHLLAFYESKKLSGFKYNSAESVISQFDDYYNSLGITELKLSRGYHRAFSSISRKIAGSAPKAGKPVF